MATASKTTERRPQQQAPQQASSGNLPATQQPEKKAPPAIVQIKTYIDERMGELAFALPAHISPERFQRVLLTALQRNHKLLACTKQSLWNACLLAAQDGLLPDGREGAIVPYGENADGKKQADVATWMPMIEGLRKKARNSGEISNWEAHIVRARDHFEVILGDTPRIDHKPYFGGEDPGPVVGAYSIAWLKDGTISREVMTKRDLDKIKAKSRASKGPWFDPTFEPEMYRKTVARRHYKQLPHSSDLDDMIRRDDEAFGLEDRNEDQIEARQQRRALTTAASFDRFAGGASGALIEHQPEDNQPENDDGAEAAFADDDQPGDTQQQNGDDQQTRGNVQTAADAEKITGSDGTVIKDRDAPDGGKAADAEKPADTGGSPEPSDGDERRWPNGATPTDLEEYEHYMETKLGDFTAASEVSDWWKSKEQADLRTACKITKTQFEELKKKATARYTALTKAQGAK